MKAPESCTVDELEPYAREWARRLRAQQPPPRQKVLRPCPYCFEKFGARDLVKHKPRCSKSPAVMEREAS
jgi:hypothetical protein